MPNSCQVFDELVWSTKMDIKPLIKSLKLYLNFISTVSADGLAPLGARPSAGTVITKICCCTYRALELNGLTDFTNALLTAKCNSYKLQHHVLSTISCIYTSTGPQWVNVLHHSVINGNLINDDMIEVGAVMSDIIKIGTMHLTDYCNETLSCKQFQIFLYMAKLYLELLATYIRAKLYSCHVKIVFSFVQSWPIISSGHDLVPVQHNIITDLLSIGQQEIHYSGIWIKL